MKNLLFRQLHAFTIPTICILVLCCLSSAVHAAEFIPLGFLPGHDASEFASVSDDGTVVSGRSRNTAESNGRAFRWTESNGMLDLGVLPGDTSSTPWAISGDGSTIVGESRIVWPPTAMIYTEEDGMRELDGRGSSTATEVSFDGSVVVGYDGEGAFRWTEEEGTVGLGFLPASDSSGAFGVSADGRVIVGSSGFSDETTYRGEVFRWTAEAGMIGLGVPVGPTSAYAHISADGTVIAAKGGGLTFEDDVEAYRWTEQTGAVGLGWLPGTALEDGRQVSEVSAINGDGSIILGTSGRSHVLELPFIWTEEQGMRDLYQVLSDEYGLGSELAGWTLFHPGDISANGQFIAGFGTNPNGNREAWLVRLTEPIPEPSTALLAMAGSSLLVLQSRWRRA